MTQPTSTPISCAPPCVEALASAKQEARADVRWFKEEVLPHELGLRGWIRKRFPWVSDIDDLIQDSYIQLFRARQKNGKIDHPKSYLFATVRNAAFDANRKQRRSPIDAVADLEQVDFLVQESTAADALAHAQDIEVLAEAIRSLPKRRRLVLTLCKLRGLSHREIALKLDITEATVSAHLWQALAQIREYVRERSEGEGPQP